MKTLWLASRDLLPRSGPLGRMTSLLDYTAEGLDGFVRKSDGFAVYKAQQLLGERLAQAAGEDHDALPPYERGCGALQDLLAYERAARFTGEYLTKVDGASMHHGLEARSPFLDQALWDFASALPFELRLRHGRLKAILRELARRRIGPQLANRAKTGFGVPVQRWIAGRWRAQVESMFHDSLLEREGWLRKGAVLRELKRADAHRPAPRQLWYLTVLESWLRHERGHARGDAAAERAAAAWDLASLPAGPPSLPGRRVSA
jgi:asparagine synthase (glutamine-hydrolysing)